jgi:hypothetical protein
MPKSIYFIVITFISSSAFAQCPDNVADLPSLKIFLLKLFPLVSSEQKIDGLLPLFKFPLYISGPVDAPMISISKTTFSKYYRQIFVKTPPHHSSDFMEHMNQITNHNYDERDLLKWEYDGADFLTKTFKNGCAAYSPYNDASNGWFGFTWTKESGWRVEDVSMGEDYPYIEKFLRQKKALVYKP